MNKEILLELKDGGELSLKEDEKGIYIKLTRTIYAWKKVIYIGLIERDNLRKVTEFFSEHWLKYYVLNPEIKKYCTGGK